MHYFYAIICITALSSCSRPGDGRESGSDKREWSVLQSLIAKNESISNQRIQFIKAEEYLVIRLFAIDDKTPIWIMLDPKSPPFYKQMPPNLNYSVSKGDLEIIQKQAAPISTVTQALESHLKAEQDAAANP